MNHIDLQTLLRYVRHEVSDDDWLAVDEHLADCIHCLGRVRALRRLRTDFATIWESWTAEEHGRLYLQYRLAKAILDAEADPNFRESAKSRALEWLRKLGTNAADFAVGILLDGGKRIASVASEMPGTIGRAAQPYILQLQPMRLGVGSPDEMSQVEKHREKASAMLAQGRIAETIEHLQSAVEIDMRAAQGAILDIRHEKRLVGRIQVDSRRKSASLMYWPAPGQYPLRLAILLPREEDLPARLAELKPVEAADYLLAEFEDLGDGSYTLLLEPAEGLRE